MKRIKYEGKLPYEVRCPCCNTTFEFDDREIYNGPRDYGGGYVKCPFCNHSIEISNRSRYRTFREKPFAFVNCSDSD